LVRAGGLGKDFETPPLSDRWKTARSAERRVEGAAMRSQDAGRYGVSVSGNAELAALSVAWREKHRAEDSRGSGAAPACSMEIRRLLA